MKHTRSSALYAGAVLLAAIAGVSPGKPTWAHEPAGAKGAAAKDTAAFKDAGAVWQKVAEEGVRLDKLIKAKKLEEVHESAFEVRDLVRQLPDKSKSLPADKQKQLAGHVKHVDQIAVLLDKYGDSKQQTKVEAEQKELIKALHTIEHLYPQGTVKHAFQSAHQQGGAHQQGRAHKHP